MRSAQTWRFPLLARLPGKQRVAPRRSASRLLVRHVSARVNADGLIGFLTSNFESLQEARHGIASLGLNDCGTAIDDALELLGFANLPADEDAFDEAVSELLDDERRSDARDQLDQKVIDSSAEIGAAIHAYIQSHILAFQRLD